MTFDRLDSNSKTATVSLTCAEIRDIVNMMCTTGYNGRLHAEFFLLFEIVKNGGADSFTAEHFNELMHHNE